jgi:hypothetical protein
MQIETVDCTGSRVKTTARKQTLKSGPVSRGRVVIYENESGQSWYVYERARYVREPQLRAAWLLRARRPRGDARPDDDDARRRGGERRLRDDAHAPDASVIVPSALAPFLRLN